MVCLVPFALLPWPIAMPAYVLTSTALYLTALLLLAQLAPGTWQGLHKPAFLACGLAFAPVHSSLHVSNPSCLSASLLFLGIYLMLRPGHSDATQPIKPSTAMLDTLAIAALLALSICIKPTQGSVILVFLLWSRAWRTFAATLAAILLITATSLLPLLHLGQAWITQLNSNLHYAFTDGTASLFPRNLVRLDRIDLQLPLYILTNSTTLAAKLAAAIAAILLLAALTLPLGTLVPTRNQALLRLSVLLAIGILPTYQRFYSATVLLLPILWAICNLSATLATRRIARVILALSTIFLVNTTVLQRYFQLAPRLSGRLPIFANAFIAPHLNWFLLGFALLLLAAIPITGRDAAPPKTT